MRLLALLGTVLAVAGCGALSSDAHLCAALFEAPADRSPSLPHLVLVTIDGVRAEDIFAADARTRLPNLYRLIDHGVALGSPSALMRASGPRYVSLPGYREILTGRRGADCSDNDCPALHEPTLLDELRLRGGLDGGEIVTIASWEIIERAASAAPSAITLSTGRHGGASRSRLAEDSVLRQRLDEGARARPFPGHGDYRPDAFTTALALALVAARQPRVLWLALGDTDEWAHRGDRARYLDALAAADLAIGALAAAAPPDTIFIVTGDHGRSANFRDHGDSLESAASFLVAAGGAVPVRGVVASAPEHHLADVAPSLRALLHLGRDLSPRAGAPIAELLPDGELLVSSAR